MAGHEARGGARAGAGIGAGSGSVLGRGGRWRRVLLAVAALVLVVAALAVGWRAAEREVAAQGAASVREAVLRAAAQCCAVEGSYPHSLSHLEEHYGLAVNHRDYAIIYEAFASNVAPSVVVTPR